MLNRLFRVRKKPGEIYMRRPIRIKWRPGSACRFFDWHAVEDRAYTYYQVYHLGPIIIKIGEFTGRYDAAGRWIPKESK